MEIIEIVKKEGPITGEHIADHLQLTRATLRPDLAILTMSGFLEARPRVGYYYTGKGSQLMAMGNLAQITVGQIKSLPVSIRETATSYDAVVTMFTEDVGNLTVINQEGFLEGVISRKDLLKIALGGSELQKIPVGIVMTRMPNIITAQEDEPVFKAAEKLIFHEVDSLPVVKGQNTAHLEVIGRITKTNITKLMVELAQGS